MECVVCKKQFTGGECPRCHFPVVEFPGDPEAGLAAIQPQIQSYRRQFLSMARFGVVAYRHHDVDGVLKQDGGTELTIGSGQALQEHPVFLDQPFAWTPGTELTVSLRLTLGGEEREDRVKVPNFPAPTMTQIGLQIDADNQYQVLLRDARGETVCSETMPIFR